MPRLEVLFLVQEIDPQYDLFAVSNHYGGLGGGHYTAFCKVNEANQWYCFDDSHTKPVNPEDVVTPAAYVLFYRRRKESQQDKGETPIVNNSGSVVDFLRVSVFHV